MVSRFRLRQNGGSSGDKKRHLERPLSQIICHLDSALLLNNSPSFSILQPRSEERLSAISATADNTNTGNSRSTVTEEEIEEDDDIMGIPRAVVQCLNDLENPPIPPLR